MLISQSETYCKAHIIEKKKPFENAVRSNETLYNTSKWRKLRKRKLSEQSFCSKCGSQDNLHIHHRIPPLGDMELFFEYENLDVLCGKCHRIETNKEILYRRK
jgi:5-methylcytosine-specific restriction endonuclease McrA